MCFSGLDSDSVRIFLGEALPDLMGCQIKYGAVNVFTHPHEIDEAGTLVAQKNPFLLRPLNLLLNLEQFWLLSDFCICDFSRVELGLAHLQRMM